MSRTVVIFLVVFVAATAAGVYGSMSSTTPSRQAETATSSAQIRTYESNGTSSKPAVVMVPGLGLSGDMYTGTPDGRAGWAQLFQQRGYDTYVVNPARNVSTSTLAANGSEQYSRWSQQQFWTRWGLGPEVGTGYEDVKYPIGHVDTFVANLPHYTQGGAGGQQGGGSGGGRFASSGDTDAITSVVTEHDAAILMVHSAAGPVGFQVARQYPERVAGVIAVEPVGCPVDSAAQFADSDTFLVALYGDYIDSRNQTGRKQACQRAVDAVTEAGGTARMIDLPAQGIDGNTHLMMQDINNEVIAEKIMEYIETL